jgi:adenylate cyclase class 2
MAPESGHVETEIKLPVTSVATALASMESAGLRVHKQRIFEINLLFDTAQADLRRKKTILRLRQAGNEAWLSFKGPPVPGRHKVREEIEIPLAGIDAMKSVLERLGFLVSFRYEKYRTEFTDGDGIVTLDETPIGNYLELEGSAVWIDSMAPRLGYQEGQYITKSYGRLYLEFCERQGVIPSQMVF